MLAMIAHARQRAGRSGGWERAPAATGTPEPELEVKTAIWSKWRIFFASQKKL